MARSVAGRYLVAAFAFMAAATWLGVGLKGGFTCLLVFVLAFQAVRLSQGRNDSRSRRAGSRRERSPRYEPLTGEETDLLLPEASGRDRSRPSNRVYDGDQEFGWPMASEAT